MSELPAPLAQPDLKEAIEYALLVKSAEECSARPDGLPPGRHYYHHLRHHQRGLHRRDNDLRQRSGDRCKPFAY